MFDNKKWAERIRRTLEKAVLLDGEERKSVAERLGVPEGTLNRWVNEARKKQKEFLDYPEKVKTQPARKEPVSDPEPPTGNLCVDWGGMENGISGLCDFVDAFSSCGFLTENEAARLLETADEATFYVRGMKWALGRKEDGN